MKEAVTVENISKSYGEIKALDGVSLSVNKGELFGIIGPDGSGKSSLYKILSTLASPDKGKASVFGLDTTKESKRLRNLTGYMPERFSLYQDLTVMENINFFASLFGVSVEDSYDIIAPVFRQLEKYPNRRAGALSGGMKQKLALSCALIHRPAILLLDEPTTGVDAVSRSEFWEMLSSLKSRGITIVVSTSYMDEATKCERIAMINKGKILQIDSPHNLVAQIGETIYNASANDMFGLLQRLKMMPGVKDCYTYGATLHVVTDDDFNAEATITALARQDMSDVKIYRGEGTIEDLFIKLTRDGK